MLERLLDVVLGRQPGARAAMALADSRRIDLALQPPTQHIAEQVVKAVPVAFVVQGHQEQAHPLNEVEQTTTVARRGTTDQGITERRTEPFEDRDLEQELPQLRRLTIEHLVQQVAVHRAPD